MTPDTTRLHASISAVFSIGLLSVHLYKFLLQGRISVFWFGKNARTRTDGYTCIHVLASMWPQAITESARSQSSATQAHSFIFPTSEISHCILTLFTVMCRSLASSPCAFMCRGEHSYSISPGTEWKSTPPHLLFVWLSAWLETRNL